MLEKFHKAVDELSRKYRRKELKEKLFDNQNEIANEYSTLIGEMENLSLKIEEIREKIKNLIEI